MDIQADKLCTVTNQQLSKDETPLEIIPSEDKKTLSLIREREEEMETSFADFLVYSADGVRMLPVDSVAFHTETDDTGRTTELSFVILGHTLPLCDFAAFSSVTRVVFTGHFSFITSAFKIISQLTSLTSVSFELNKFQLPFFLENFEDDLTILHQNPSVTSLEIYADPKQTDVTLTDRILDVLFSRAEVCLPSLKNLYLQLPLVPVAKKIFLRILRNSVVNPCEQKVTYVLPQESASPTLTCVYEAETPRTMPFHILTSWNSSVMDHFPKCFRDYYNSHSAKHLLDRIFGSSNAAQWMFSKSSFGSYKSEMPVSSSSEGWAPSYLEVSCDFYFAHNGWELIAKIPFTKNGKAFDTEIEALWELGRAVSTLRFRQNELIKPSEVEAAKRVKAKRQFRICKMARSVGTRMHDGFYGPSEFPRYPKCAPQSLCGV